MSKKDYQALARAIYAARQSVLRSFHDDERDFFGRDRWTLTEVTNKIVSALAADNPRFDRARFIEACETGTTRGMRKGDAR